MTCSTDDSVTHPASRRQLVDPPDSLDLDLRRSRRRGSLHPWITLHSLGIWDGTEPAFGNRANFGARYTLRLASRRRDSHGGASRYMEYRLAHYARCSYSMHPSIYTGAQHVPQRCSRASLTALPTCHLHHLSVARTHPMCSVRRSAHLPSTLHEYSADPKHASDASPRLKSHNLVAQACLTYQLGILRLRQPPRHLITA